MENLILYLRKNNYKKVSNNTFRKEFEAEGVIEVSKCRGMIIVRDENELMFDDMDITYEVFSNEKDAINYIEQL